MAKGEWDRLKSECMDGLVLGASRGAKPARELEDLLCRLAGSGGKAVRDESRGEDSEGGGREPGGANRIRRDRSGR